MALKSVFIFYSFAICLLGVTSVSNATAWFDIEAFQSSLPGQNILQLPEQQQLYVLPLGMAKKVHGRVILDDSKKIIAKVTRSTYELDTTFAFDDAQALVKAALSNLEILYTCDSQACGVSSFWVESILTAPRIVGLDSYQSVWVASEVGSKAFHVLYLVQRGNRRVYLHYEKAVVVDQSKLSIGPFANGLTLLDLKVDLGSQSAITFEDLKRSQQEHAKKTSGEDYDLSDKNWYNPTSVITIAVQAESQKIAYVQAQAVKDLLVKNGVESQLVVLGGFAHPALMPAQSGVRLSFFPGPVQP